MAIESVTFPAKIGGEHINIKSDILDNDIPFSHDLQQKKCK